MDISFKLSNGEWSIPERKMSKINQDTIAYYIGLYSNNNNKLIITKYQQ